MKVKSDTNFKDVGDFHRKFGLPAVDGTAGTVPHELDDSTALFRLKFLLEELKEIAEGYGYELSLGEFLKLEDASARQDLIKVADGLVDLVYVTLGTAQLHGFPWEALFAEVQRANMSKERAASAKDSRSTRRHLLDVVKPKGFLPPNIVGVLMEAGWLGPSLPLNELGDNER